MRCDLIGRCSIRTDDGNPLHSVRCPPPATVTQWTCFNFTTVLMSDWSGVPRALIIYSWINSLGSAKHFSSGDGQHARDGQCYYTSLVVATGLLCREVRERESKKNWWSQKTYLTRMILVALVAHLVDEYYMLLVRLLAQVVREAPFSRRVRQIILRRLLSNPEPTWLTSDFRIGGRCASCLHGVVLSGAGGKDTTGDAEPQPFIWAQTTFSLRKMRRNLETTFGATRSLSTAASWERVHPIWKLWHEGCHQTDSITVDIPFEGILKCVKLIW